MRNQIAQSLGARQTLTVEIDPPIGPDEQHYLLSIPTSQPVVVRAIDTAHVEITNPHTITVFFIFAIAPVVRMPTGIREAISAFIAARKQQP